MALLTVRAAADRLGIGYSTLKQWIHQGRDADDADGGRAPSPRRGRGRPDDRRARARVTPGSPRCDAGPAGLIVALSGRNQLRGFVEEVRIDGLLGQVRLRIGDQTLTAVITSDARTS